ncbi:MAG: class D sortase [Acidobacteriia bacterium]|nr:class D sortase [Terriglobia bacterium]
MGLGIWAWSLARTKVYQDWENWAFDREIRGERATIGGYVAEKGAEVRGRIHSWFSMPPAPQPVIARPNAGQPPSPQPGPQPILEPNGLVGRLAIPRLHLSAMVREGTGEDTLDLSLGHVPHTALPGQDGNVAVAGHRDTIFRGLRGIHENDLIHFETLGGNYVYQVETTQIVKPQDVGVLKAGEHPELTLITCYPFYYVGSAPDRFIVKARQVSQDGVENSSLQAPQKTQPSDQAVTERPEAVQQEAESPPAAQQGAETPPAPRQSLALRQSPAVRHSALNRATRAARGSRGVEDPSAARKVAFSLSANHSRELAPGISFGLDRTDVAHHRVDGWMWVMPERRTIWLHDHSARQPVIFYGSRDGRRRELVITGVTKYSVAGYLVLAEAPHRKATFR